MGAGEESPPDGLRRELDLADFCSETYGHLVGLVSLYLGDRFIAEDIAQETLVKVCRHWSRVSRMEAPQAWARQVALNLAKSWLRRLRLRSRETMRAEASAVEDPYEAIAVRSLVSSLPPRQRLAVVLRYYEGLQGPEIAKIMGCAEGTVRALTSQGLQTLRSRLHEKSEVHHGL